MFDSAVVLTPLHYVYLIGVLVILAVMVLRKDTPAVCIAFLFLLGVIGLGSITGGIMTVFNSILFAAKEFMEVIATIALVTALSKCLKDLGSDYLMMVPMSNHHAALLPLPLAVTFRGLSRRDYAAICSQGRFKTARRGHGYEPFRSRNRFKL